MMPKLSASVPSKSRRSARLSLNWGCPSVLLPAGVEPVLSGRAEGAGSLRRNGSVQHGGGFDQRVSVVHLATVDGRHQDVKREIVESDEILDVVELEFTAADVAQNLVFVEEEIEGCRSS